MTRVALAALFALSAVALRARADVTLVANGQSQCVIVTDAATMAADKVPAPQKFVGFVPVAALIPVMISRRS